MEEIKNTTRGGEATQRFLKTTLDSALREIMSVLNAECGSLFLYDPSHEELVLEIFYNSNNLSVLGLKKRMGEGISGRVANLSVPVLVRNLDFDHRFRRNGFNHYRSNSFISIPLYYHKGLLGLVNLTDKISSEPFNEKDLKYAVTITKYACMTVDIFTESIQISQQKDLLDKQKNALEKYASVGKLAAGIVHEVNNPLDGIIRYTNILLAQLEDNSASRDYLLEIKAGLDRIANISKSLLAFSYAVNHHSQVLNYIDVNYVIDESLVALNGIMNAKVKVIKNYHPHLPKIVDCGIQHIFINIIKNALDAMPEGGRLEISTLEDDTAIKVRFKDSGSGIDQKIKEHIFEPFFTTKDMDKGTGLGLAICREIIHNYEGDIEVESIAGKGSIFTVVVPKKKAKNAQTTV